MCQLLSRLRAAEKRPPELTRELPCNFEKGSDHYLAMIQLGSFMNLAGPDLIVILLIILVLFGAKKLPELARGMGQAVKEFQKAKDEFSDELHKAGKSDAEAAKPEVRPAEATVPRTDTAAAPAARPDPNRTITPGDKADQV
jgi:sec-independent protein translocase protein TatA